MFPVRRPASLAGGSELPRLSSPSVTLAPTPPAGSQLDKGGGVRTAWLVASEKGIHHGRPPLGLVVGPLALPSQCCNLPGDDRDPRGPRPCRDAVLPIGLTGADGAMLVNAGAGGLPSPVEGLPGVENVVQRASLQTSDREVMDGKQSCRLPVGLEVPSSRCCPLGDE